MLMMRRWGMIKAVDAEVYIIKCARGRSRSYSNWGGGGGGQKIMRIYTHVWYIREKSRTAEVQGPL